ncbi:type I restriction endonuclease subunit R [Reichenbachiella sp. MSK19-1]|uniref:type I restriction endonuclease subunit R n=1 Tax=Reichenbachiella sp. MSK19-1 TaxID=1897631 RepID=UPI000E6CF0CD|nr:type I restriction endonuclease [Reichenbachiella sp. MSK19-1]RJE74953.1 DEAD/DEAH box helicase [Reichenbachiella sp. MSK19-1]
MKQPTDTSEKAFQKLIVKALVEDQCYETSMSNDFDREFCINKDQLMDFLEKTQLATFNYIQQKGERSFLVRLDKRIQEKGIIEVLRKGLKYNDKTIYLFYPEPNSAYNVKDKAKYDANIFSATEELVYTDNNKNRLDLTIFLNGLPIITMELKNAFTHQAVQNAIKQYMYDRNPKDKIFNLGRCMVHFAADTTQIYMAGSLAHKNTAFFPFNKGQNEGKPFAPFGAGNPVNPNGLKTAYLWEEVLSKSSLSNIIEKFATLVEEKDQETGKVKRIQIFPRYHQLTSVKQLLQDSKNNGVGVRYLIQHSAGSGKSNSITWLALQLVSLYDQSNTTPLFDSIVVVTDRKVLDEQLRKNIKAFAQVKKVVEAITGEARDIKALDPEEDSFSKTTHMRLALANNKKIITCTVQTFPFVLKTVQDMSSKKVAILIDEAHSSQSGEAAASLNALFADINADEIPRDEDGKISTEDLLNHLVEGRKMLPNASYYAFTATPKNKTLETFGTKQPYRDEHGEEHFKYMPFHTYSMKQAIEEEFILDVLKNYTTWKSFYKVKQDDEATGEEQFETKQANKKIRSFVEGHELAIAEKSRIMIDHFMKHVRTRIENKAKAMIVCKSIESTMKYKEAFDQYLKEINAPYKAIVAFSGKKKHWKTGEELTEERMNQFPDNLNDIPKQFNKDEYRFLIVADKYQTGFDQPLLHTMYVDKQLSDVQAVQTLSRLNRAKKPAKRETFVLDFFNDVEDIQKAFQPYYTTTILSRETDPNKLNDLQEKLDEVQIYDLELIQEFFEDYYDEATGRDRLDSIISEIERNFNEELIKDQQIEFKANAKSFVRTYSYLSRIIDFKDFYWEMLWLTLKHLIPHLMIEEEKDEENILEVIDMDSYRTSRIIDKTNIVMEDEAGMVDPIPVQIGGGRPESEFDTLERIVNSFNRRFGDIDWGDGVDANEAEKVLTKDIPDRLENDQHGLLSILNSDKANAREESNNLVKAIMQGMMFTNTSIYKKYADDDAFRSRYQEFIFDLIWAKPRKSKS